MSSRKPRKSGTQISAQNSAKRKGKPRGKAFDSDNPYKFKSKAELGGALDPKINAGGRPKLLGESYRAQLAKLTDEGITHAEDLARSMVTQAVKGDVQAAKELRVATEGETLNLNGYSDDQLKEYIAGRLARLGIVVGASGETETNPATTAEHAGSTPG